jgi:hypothetical protein
MYYNCSAGSACTAGNTAGNAGDAEATLYDIIMLTILIPVHVVHYTLPSTLFDQRIVSVKARDSVSCSPLFPSSLI